MIILYWLQFILAVSFIACQTQVCKLQSNFQNLLQMNDQETYHLYLQDYFVGDGLIYSLNVNTEYFQANIPQNLGGILSEAISLIPKPKKVVQQIEFLILLRANEADEETYEIHSIRVFLKKSNFLQVNSLQDLIMIAFVGSLYYNHIKNSKIISKSAGPYLCTLINNGEHQDDKYVSNYAKLILFQLEQTTNIEDQNIIINLVQLNQIENLDDFISGFDIVKEGFLFICYYNLGVQIHLLNYLKSYQIDVFQIKGILGINAYKILYGFTEYNIFCWDEQKLLNFLNDQSKIKIISREILIETTQITLLLNFATSVFINEKYIVISNINGISIYPTIINDVNESRLLYYYPTESKISYFINILNYLISVEEQSLILQMINDHQSKQKIFKMQKVSFKLGQNPVNLINLKFVRCLIYIFKFSTNIKITLMLKAIMINLMRFNRKSFIKEFIQKLDNILVIQKSIQIVIKYVKLNYHKKHFGNRTYIIPIQRRCYF